jgi:hypothetical protein
MTLAEMRRSLLVPSPVSSIVAKANKPRNIVTVVQRAIVYAPGMPRAERRYVLMIIFGLQRAGG